MLLVSVLVAVKGEDCRFAIFLSRVLRGCIFACEKLAEAAGPMATEAAEVDGPQVAEEAAVAVIGLLDGLVEAAGAVGPTVVETAAAITGVA